jgi:hypothetical protein
MLDGFKINKTTMTVDHNKPQPRQFYYHFKHDPQKGLSNYAFEVVGTGVHTETEEIYVIYKSVEKLEDSRANRNKVDYNIRPMKMFLEEVSKPEYNYKGPRFSLIDDEAILSELKKFKS